MTEDKKTKTVNKVYDPEKDSEAKSGTDQFPRLERKGRKGKKILIGGLLILLGIVCIIVRQVALNEFVELAHMSPSPTETQTKEKFPVFWYAS